MKKTLTLELEGGGRKEFDLDLITEYGACCEVVTVPPIAGVSDQPTVRPGKRHCFVKVKPVNDTFYITKESLESIYALKQSQLKSLAQWPRKPMKRKYKYKYHVVLEFEDNDEKFTVVKYFGIHKQWWHYEVLDEMELSFRKKAGFKVVRHRKRNS